MQDFSLEVLRATEKAAIASAGWVGKNNPKNADLAAVKEMRPALNEIKFRGKVVIGEGEKDSAPQLYRGEKLGQGGPNIDLAINPLECTDNVARGSGGAISVIAFGPENSLFGAPDTYMEKIAVGPKGLGSIDLNDSVKKNIQRVSVALEKEVKNLVVVVLDRPRHDYLIKEISRAGAKVLLIKDGDVDAAISTCFPGLGIDLLMGTGGSTEAVLAAAAMKHLGGSIFCRFVPKKEEDKIKIRDCLPKLVDLDYVYGVDDLIKRDQVIFIATGVLDGFIVKGVDFKKDKILVHSLIVGRKTGRVECIDSCYNKLNEAII
jgi:fructose-1,6-bisphosphatase II